MTLVSWKSPISGAWTTASNWDDNLVPNGIGVDVTLGAGASPYTVTLSGANLKVEFLDVDADVTLDIASGSLAIGSGADNGSAEIDGDIVVAKGARLSLGGADYAGLYGSGTITVAGTLEAAAGMGTTFWGDTIDLTGGVLLGATTTSDFFRFDVALSGYGTIGNGFAVSSGGSNPFDNNGLSFAIANGATLDASGGAGQALILNTGANLIENGGTIEATGAGGIVFDSTLSQDGVFTVEAGSSATIADGANVTGTAGLDVASGGLVRLNNGSINASGGIDIGSATAPGGEITTTSGNNGASADLIWATLNNNGAIVVAANSTFQLGVVVYSGASGTVDLDATSLAAVVEVIEGLARFVGGKVVLSNSVKNEFVSNGGYVSLNNLATLSGSGVIGDGYLRLSNGFGGVIDANGTAGLSIVADTLAVSANASNFTNFNNGLMEATAAGTVAADVGTLTFQAGVFDNAGEILAASQGKVLLDGAQISSGGGEVSVASGGRLELENGAAVFGQSGLTVDAGGLVYTGADGSTDVIKTQIYLSGTLDIVANSNLLASTQWVGSGTVDLGASTGAATITVVAGSNLDLWGDDIVRLLNAGDQIVSAGAGSLFRNRDGGDIVGEGVIGDANLFIQNSAGGTIDATGALSLGFSASAPQIANAGVMEATGVGVLTLASTVSNTGEIIAGKGAKVVAQQQIIGPGREILEGGTLEIGANTTNLTVFESGTKSALIFDDQAGNNAPISGFAAGDTIDEKNFAYGDGKFTFASSPTVTNFSAVFQNSLGADSAGLNLNGDYLAAAGAFSFSQDTGGGTIIHWTPKS